jgi:predicted GNAT superfamily acetyltransferase
MPLNPSEINSLFELNQSEVPHVGSVTLPRLQHLAQHAIQLPIERADGVIAGFVILFDQDTEYDSENFLWFRDRYERFAYVDRVVVGQAFRRQGIANRLYTECIEFCRASAFPILTLEINIQPPNPTSLSFHQKMGFQEVGTLQTLGSDKSVSMQALRILSE